MSLYDLKTEALALPETWHSRVLGRIGTANLKVLLTCPPLISTPRC